MSGNAKAKRRLDRIIWEYRLERASELGFEAVPMERWTTHDLRMTFSTQACEVL